MGAGRSRHGTKTYGICELFTVKQLGISWLWELGIFKCGYILTLSLLSRVVCFFFFLTPTLRRRMEATLQDRRI